MLVVHKIIRSKRFILDSVVIDNDKIDSSLMIVIRDTDTDLLRTISSVKELENVYGVVPTHKRLLLVAISKESWKSLDYIKNAEEYFLRGNNSRSIKDTINNCTDKIKPIPISNHTILSTLCIDNIIVVFNKKFYLKGHGNTIIFNQSDRSFTIGMTIYDFFRGMLKSYPSLYNYDEIKVICIKTSLKDNIIRGLVFNLTSGFRSHIIKNSLIKR